MKGSREVVNQGIQKYCKPPDPPLPPQLFQARMACAPDQCLRYCFQEAALLAHMLLSPSFAPTAVP